MKRRLSAPEMRWARIEGGAFDSQGIPKKIVGMSRRSSLPEPTTRAMVGGVKRIISVMSTTVVPMTVDEFLKLPEVEGEKKELIRGEVADVPRGDEPAHERTKANLSEILVLWLHEHRDGRVFVGSPYILDDYNCLAPDISVLNGERLKRGIDDLFRGAPNLAIEVVSSETAARLRTKIGLYLEHGSKAAWVVYPEARLVETHGANGQVKIFKQDQILEDPDTLPGFSTPIGAIFEGL